MCHWDPADSALLIFFSGSSAEKKMDTYLEYMFFNIPILLHLLMEHITGWWFGTMEFY